MPEYLAPGVYVEEVSFRSKSIEGVSTTTAGLVGPTRFGPIDMEPDIITSLGEFERVYGDGRPLEFDGPEGLPHNFVWHAVRAFFEEGGRRLYVVRVYRQPGGDGAGDDGRAAWRQGQNSPAGDLRVTARFPGRSGNRRVGFSLRIGQNVLAVDRNGRPTVNGLQDSDIVWIGTVDPMSPVTPNDDLYRGAFYRAEVRFDPAAQRESWRFHNDGVTIELDPDLHSPIAGQPAIVPGVQEIRAVRLSVTVQPSDPTSPLTVSQVWEDLAFDYRHRNFGVFDSVTSVFHPDPEKLSNRGLARSLPISIFMGSSFDPETAQDQPDGLAVLNALISGSNNQLSGANWIGRAGLAQSFEIAFVGGSDGLRPGAAEYEGQAPEDQPVKTGLKALEDVEDVSMVMAPAASFDIQGDGAGSEGIAITGLLISHAERMRYRIAVLDSGPGQTIADVRALRAKLDSKYAALYFPWVRVLDPITRKEIHLPPSGFVGGIYARNDIERAVYKAPANEVVRLAIGFEMTLNKSQQDVLNPEGINCFRFFEGRGFRLWGARTISSDPEWKYVNLRRYFAFLERSIDKGTQWAVFEPNGEALWANVRRTIEDFLLNEWMRGALLGDKPEKSYFVRCDRSTMTQNDIDNGRLVCLIGVAALRPAEFVIFRIGQMTLSART